MPVLIKDCGTDISTCGPVWTQIFMQHAGEGHIHDVVHQELGRQPLLYGLECDADVFVVQQGVRLVGPVCLDRCWDEVGLCCSEIPKSAGSNVR